MGTAALIVSAGVLISRILGQLREIIFASLLGATGSTDEYVAAFAIPDFLNYLLAGGFLSITFIPILSRYLADDDEEGGWEALSAIIRPVAAGLIGLIVVGWVLAPRIIGALFPRFNAGQIANTIHYTRIVLPAQLFFVLGALFAAVQYTKGVFAIPTLAPIIYNLGIITGGVGYAVVTGNPSPEGFIWGALCGAFLGNFVLQWWGARRVGMRLDLRIPWRNPVLKEYLLIAFPLMIGQSIVVLDETFMKVFGQFVGSGAATELNYARRTMLVPVGVIAQAAGVATYPFLARLFAEGKVEAMKNAVDRALRYVLVFSMAAAALVAAMTVPVVRALFQRDGTARVRRVFSTVGRTVPLVVIGGGAAFAVAAGVDRIVSFDTLGSLPITLISLVTVAAGTALFAAVALGLGTLLFDWLTPGGDEEQLPEPAPG
jgi:putative peptidoglycan lipid II flippase